MADLRIVDAPEIPTENITGEEKLPTGGNGNYSISLDSLADYTKTKKDLADNTSVDGKVNGVRQELEAHIEDFLNPHQVTKGQIGLGNVDNTADSDKPVSNSTQAAIISAVAPKADKTYVDNQLTLKANKTDVYTKSETYTKQESSDLVNGSISTALIPVNSSLDLAKRGIANRYDQLLSYNSGERVVLTNGDIVKSTIDGNTNDPNSDMTGWEFAIPKTVKTISDLSTISPVIDGMEVDVLDDVSGGKFIYKASRSSENDGGIVINGWVRRYVLFATPEMFGVIPNDQTGSYGSKLNSVFNCGFPVLLKKSKYYSDAPIIINDKNLSLQGVSKLESRIIFKNSGHGIVQNTTTGLHVFSINDCSITTSQNGTGNGSGFKYDATAYIATLSITGTGYKVLGNRTLNRGQISNVDFGSSDDSASPKGWKHALEFLGAMNFSVNGLHMRLPTDKSGNGVWIHGDGMPTDFHFNDVYSFWGDTVFRFNDYLEGFHLTNFELVNCNEGISNTADSDTVVAGQVRMLASYISGGHVLAYKNCIASQFLSSAKMYGLELYVWGDSSISSVSQGISVTTCDSVQIYGNTIVNANPSVNNTTIGVQLGTGWGNKVSGNTLKGGSWYAGIAVGTNSSFYGNTVVDNSVYNSDTALLINETNCSKNVFETPTIINSTNVAMSISANVLSKNSVKFKDSVFNSSYSYTSDTTFTVDISDAGFTQVPVSIDVQEVSGQFGGIEYSYRRDVSTKDSITIQTTASVTTPASGARGLLVKVSGV